MKNAVNKTPRTKVENIVSETRNASIQVVLEHARYGTGKFLCYGFDEIMTLAGFSLEKEKIGGISSSNGQEQTSNYEDRMQEYALLG